MKKLTGLIYGLIYGSLSPMPGVSAGTLGIFLNIFDRFFRAVSLANAKKNWLVILIFLSGWGIGLFGISHVIVFLLKNYGQIVYFSFIGLILGCIPMIFKKAKPGKFSVKSFAIFAVSLALMLFIVINSSYVYSDNASQEQYYMTPALFVWLFFTSSVSGMAMLIPGVGGALMMLVFGIYEIYIEAVAALDIIPLIAMGTGMTFGILAGIKLIKKLLEIHPQLLYSSIFGFIIASIYFIFPGFSAGLIQGVLSVILAISFAILAYRLSKSD